MRFTIVFLAALMLASVARADLRLVADVDGRHLPVLGAGSGSTVTVDDAGTPVSRPASAPYAIEGDLAANGHLVAWSPNYSITRLEARSGPHVVGGVSIRHMSEWAKEKRASDFLRRWAGGVKERALVVAAWVAGGRITQVAVVPIESTERNTYQIVSHTFDLTESEADGQAVLLLWQDGRFVPPAPLFKNPAAEKTLPAVELDDVTAVRAAVDGGLNVMERGRDDCTLLLFAAEAGAVQVVDLLLARGAKPNAKNDEGSAPLTWAADKGRGTVVEHLLAARASPGAGDDAQPLIGAIKHGHDAIARRLIAAKAPVNQRNSQHQSAFTIAIDDGDAGLAELMYPRAEKDVLDSEQSSRVLITQAALDHGAMVAFLVKHGVDAGAEDRGFSALRAGAWRGAGAIAHTLLAGGAKVDQADALGRTALMNACMAGNVDYAQALLEAGANPRLADAQGAGCLHFAAARGSGAIVQMLLDRGVDPHGTSGNYYSPVELALVGGAADVATLLAAHGAGLDPRSKHMAESMIASLHLDLPELVRSALAAGWSPATPLDGWSAVRVAEAFHAEKCLSVLRAAGAVDFSAQLPAITRAAALDVPPRIMMAVNPEDPRSLDQSYPQAEVEIDAILGPDGHLLFPAIHRSDEAQLALVTLLTMTQWRFTPATLHGAPAFARIRIPVEFPSSADRVIAASRVDVPPRALKLVPPRYPVELKRRGIVGRVNLRFTVDKKGQVVNARVISSSDPLFEPAAIEAVQAWRFEPGRFNGEPANCEVEQPFSFNLNP